MIEAAAECLYKDLHCIERTLKQQLIDTDHFNIKIPMKSTRANRIDYEIEILDSIQREIYDLNNQMSHKNAARAEIID